MGCNKDSTGIDGRSRIKICLAKFESGDFACNDCPRPPREAFLHSILLLVPHHYAALPYSSPYSEEHALERVADERCWKSFPDSRINRDFENSAIAGGRQFSWRCDE